MGFDEIFTGKAQQLWWRRLDDDRVIDGSTPASFDKDGAYYVIRLKEMFLRTSRRLWRKLSPVLHAFVRHGAIEDNSVAGPGQLKELGDARLDRVVHLNQLLAGPRPFTGEDLQMVVGLFSVPSGDATRALIDTVSTLAGLGGFALGSAAQIATVVKNGVEQIVGLDSAVLQLGVRDTFYPGNPLRPGYHLGVAAPIEPGELARLWLVNGRLVSGDDPIAARPYEAHDYFVIEIERRLRRDDWAGLRGIAELNQQFAATMAAPGDAATKRARLAQLWPAFTQALRGSTELTAPDRAAIAADVQHDLRARLDAENPFELRDLAGRPRPSAFDFVDVAATVDPADPADAARARATLDGPL